MTIPTDTGIARLRHDMVLLKKAANAIDEVADLDTVMNMRDQAEAVRSLHQRFNLSEEILIQASIIKVKAERRIGELLGKINFHQGGRPKKDAANQLQHDTSLTLKDIGLNKTDSSRWQMLSQLPSKKFDSFVHGEVEAGRLPTTTSLLREVKQYLAKKRVEETPKMEGFTTNLMSLVAKGKKFATIYADPPWEFRNRSSNGAANNHYTTLSIDNILGEPVKELVGKKAHLHLWCPASFLAEGLAVLKAWGFTYKSYFVWVKPYLGTGNYYRRADELMLFGDRCIGEDHEMLMLGTRGGEEFLDHSTRSWAEYERRGHSRKPLEVKKMIEKVSPGPYLEMYARDKATRNWTHYGNQIIDS